MMKLTALGGLCLLATLPGCGVTYISPLVEQEAAGFDVRVLPLTRESVRLANRAPYSPRSLPAVFSQTAGGSTGGASAGDGGSGLPTPPIVPDLAPGQLELRPPPPATIESYRLGVGDVVRLATRSPAVPADAVAGEVAAEELRQEYTVRDDGAVGLPEVGAVQVEGLTIEEAEAALFQRFIDTGIDPTFSLEVAEFNSRAITVGGDVGAPAVIPVTLNVPTLDEALSTAGGLAVETPEYASIRIYRDGTLYQIPIDDYTDRGDLRATQLVPGDAVFVDTSYDLDRALEYYATQIEVADLRRTDRARAVDQLLAEIGLRRAELEEARGLFGARSELGAEDRDYVYLAGEVTEQGRYPLPYGQQASLADVLFGSGGFETETGNPSQIYVLRTSADPAGAVTALHLDASNAVNLTLATALEMRPDDIVFIEEQPITRWNRAFQQFFPVLISTAGGAAG